MLDARGITPRAPMPEDFQTCREVDRATIDRAFAPARDASDSTPRERALALLERMAGVAQPGDDVGAMLEVLARMAGCGWVEGQLAVVIRSRGTSSEVDVLAFDGLSYARLLRPLETEVPLDDFVLHVASRADTLQPLALVLHEPGEEIQLVSTEAPADSMRMPEMHPSSAPPPPSIHRKDTLEVPAMKIPAEALRKDREEAARVPTAKIRRVSPGSYSVIVPEVDDDGWE